MAYVESIIDIVLFPTNIGYGEADSMGKTSENSGVFPVNEYFFLAVCEQSVEKVVLEVNDVLKQK